MTTTSNGPVNNGGTTRICYDPAGNRSTYEVGANSCTNADGISNVGGTPTPGGTGGTVRMGGPGADNIFFGPPLTSVDVINGGDGVDTLILQGAYGSLRLSPNVTQIEGIAILAGSNTAFGAPGWDRYDYFITTHDANFAAGLQVKVNGSALLPDEDFAFNGSAETDAKFLIYGGKGRDTLIGGRGDDIFVFAEERFASGDTVNGGPGYDGMFLRGNYTIDFSNPGYGGLFTSIENLTLTSITDERYARGGGTEFDYNITLSDVLAAAGQTLTVHGGLLQSNETMIVNGSKETNAALRLFGGKAADTLKGGSQNDSLHGNLGADILSGGGGPDIFVYESTAESMPGSNDHILDFAGTDTVDLAKVDANTLVAGVQTFTWIAANAFAGTGAASAGQLRGYETSAGWFVEGDTNGDGNADLVIRLTTGISEMLIFDGTKVSLAAYGTPPVFSVTAGPPVNEGSGLTFTITRTGQATGSFDVNYQSVPGTATTPADYTHLAGKLTFALNGTQTVTIPTVADGVTESGAETLVMKLSAPSGGATLSPTQHEATGTINDSSQTTPPVFSISAGPAVNEGAALTFTVTRTGAATGSFDVTYASSPNSATAPADYTHSTGTLTFAGNGSQTISVPTVADSFTESGAETMLMTLSAPSGGATLSPAQATGTINDSSKTPTPPVFSVTGGSTGEGGLLPFIVTRTGETAGVFSVSYASSPGTATPPADYTDVSGTLTFHGNESQTINVPTRDDHNSEGGAETVWMTLSAPQAGATLSATNYKATGTINDTSGTKSSFSVSGGNRVNEGDALNFIVSRSGPTTGIYKVSYGTSPGTAQAHVDFVQTYGELTFGDGQTEHQVNVQTINDTDAEPDEMLKLAIGISASSPTLGGLIGTSEAEGTIIMNDQPTGPVSEGPLVAANDTGTMSKCEPADFAVLPNDSGGVPPRWLASVSYGGALGDASTSGNLVHFVPNQTPGTATVTYTIKDGSNPAVSASATLTITIAGGGTCSNTN